MQALLQTDAPAATFPLTSDSPSGQGLASRERQTLGERLQRTYALVETPLPARLAELVERLARREQAED
jgi:hypothetical protein